MERAPVPVRLEHSLSGRIVVFVTLVIGLCGLLAVSIISQVVSSELAERYRADQEASLEYLTTSLVPMLELKDYPRVERTIDAVLIYENIVSVEVYDVDDALVRSVVELGTEAPPANTVSRLLLHEEAAIGRVLVGFSHGYIEDQVRSLTRALAAIITALLIVTAAALLWYLGRTVVEPLRSFTGTVQAMSSTNLSLRMPEGRTDEIGLLAKSFNLMADNLEESQSQLQQAHRRLEARYQERAAREELRAEQVRRIFDLRRQIHSTNDLPGLLTYVVHALQQTFKYYSVNVFLVDSQSGDLKLAAGVGGYSGQIPLGEVSHPGEGVVGEVLQSCRPRLVSDVSTDASYIAVPQLRDTRSELAVPINIGALTLGVLDIESDRVNSLEEMDLFTAQSVADQLANVMENARLAQETRDLAILDERNRIAREIHDTLAQGFTGIVLQLEAAEQSLSESSEHAATHIESAKRLARESLNEARRSVWALRPGQLEQRDLAEAIRREAEMLASEGRVSTRYHVTGRRRRLSVEIEGALLRICQESLTNIRKHAAAHHAEIELGYGDGVITLRVRDDGVGFDQEPPRDGSFGLIGIDERARQCHGNARVSSAPGRGTQIEVVIPFERRTDDGQDQDTDRR